MDLPGPRGWLPVTFLILAVPCFPIWVAFHASTLGSILNHLFGEFLGIHYAFALLCLVGVFLLSIRGSYQKLERVQILIVGLMLLLVILTVFLLKPNWWEVFQGVILPGSFQYPDWIDQYPSFNERPVWVELSTYVGVVGGSSYDYLCYVAFIREKGWGNAGRNVSSGAGNVATPNSPSSLNLDQDCRNGLQSLRWDSLISFICVFLFSVVFVICGKLVLAPQSLTPTGGDLLTLQSAFVSEIYPQLRYVYFAGAIMAMGGTLYGTLEVGPTIVKESLCALIDTKLRPSFEVIRQWSLWLISMMALSVLLLLQAKQWMNPGGDTVSFVWILTPANLFTGVLGCGIICFATIWISIKMSQAVSSFLGKGWYPAILLGGLLFFSLGIKGYWDHGRYLSFLILAGSVTLGFICAIVIQTTQGHHKD